MIYVYTLVNQQFTRNRGGIIRIYFTRYAVCSMGNDHARMVDLVIAKTNRKPALTRTEAWAPENSQKEKN